MKLSFHVRVHEFIDRGERKCEEIKIIRKEFKLYLVELKTRDCDFGTNLDFVHVVFMNRKRNKVIKVLWTKERNWRKCEKEI